MPANRVYFLSDAHFHKTLSPRELRKRELFVRFVRGLHDASHLFILGDLFEFWFDYRTVVPRYYIEILCALRALAQGGTRILIQGGNHDYWLRSFFEREMGFTYLESPARAELQGRSIVLHHGDGLLPGDRGYKLLKRVIRSRSFIGLVRLLHPDLVNALAFRFARTSRRVERAPLRQVESFLGGRAFETLFGRENDAFVMGHVHVPVHRRRGARDFVILGDWEDYFSYLRLEGGTFFLETFEDGLPIPDLPD